MTDSIAAASTALKMAEVQQAASTAVLGKGLDIAKQEGDQLAKLLAAASPVAFADPNLGTRVDTYA